MVGANGNSPIKQVFNDFLAGLHQNINPHVTEDEAIEMLSQHLITKPVFDALFEGYEFTKFNPVAQTMQKMFDVLEGEFLEKEVRGLKKFYDSVRERASSIDIYLRKTKQLRLTICHNQHRRIYQKRKNSPHYLKRIPEKISRQNHHQTRHLLLHLWSSSLSRI